MTGDLDSETGMAIMELVKGLNEDGMTIVYVTHDPRMATFAKEVIELRDGKIMNGKPTHLARLDQSEEE
jgi:putative ABC transport system ATP-binding protein